MKVAKLAVQYYCTVTGKSWAEFYNRLDEAVSTSFEEIKDYELWLIKKLLEVITRSITVNELKANKDDIKGVFDEEARKNAGEFFTPEVWCQEARRYFDKYIPNWHEFNIWDASCYTMDTKIYIRRPYIEGMFDTWEIEDKEIIKEGQIDYVVGYVTYKNLKNIDEIYTYDKDTNKFSWSGFYNRFTKVLEGVLVNFHLCTGDTLSVTEDHRMLVRFDGHTKYEILTAKELLAFTDKLMYVKGEFHDYKVVDIDTTDTDCIVWDLTTYNDNHTFTVKTGGTALVSGNCGSGNLMRTAKHDPSKLFLSSLQEEDIVTINNTPEYDGVTAFQLDFLNRLDYDSINTDFLDHLPERLKEIIVNDEPLIFFMNPPYKSGCAKTTDVGRYMCDTGLSQSAYDLFYQFCWRVMHFVDMFNLTNTYYCVFGPLTFFSGTKAQALYKEFQKCFEFVDGMCIPAQDFSGTSESIDWGIGCTLWKSRGGYDDSIQSKGVLLEKKMLGADGSVNGGERTLYTAPRKKIEDWMQPKDVLFYREAPLATSHLTFKDSEAGSKIAPHSGKIADNALGTLMLDSTLARGNSYSAILSLPSTIQFMNITEENFWRCVASFSFRNCVNADWSDSRKWQSAPDTSIEGYDKWLMNSLGLFLCELKSMQTGLRDIQWCGDIIDVPNRLHCVSAEETKANCTDSVILEDLEKHAPQNQFILEQIEKARGYWYPEVADLFDWCKSYIIYSLNERSKVNYDGSTNAWDAGLAQLRSTLWDDSLSHDLFKKLSVVRDILSKDAGKFGFLSEYDA